MRDVMQAERMRRRKIVKEKQREKRNECSFTVLNKGREWDMCMA